MRKKVKKLPYALVVLFRDKFGIDEDDFYFVHVDDPKYFKEKRLDYKTIYYLPRQLFYERYQGRITRMHPRMIKYKKAKRTMNYVIKTIIYDKKSIVYDMTNPDEPSVILDSSNPDHIDEFRILLNTFIHDDFSPNYHDEMKKSSDKKIAKYCRRHKDNEFCQQFYS